MQQIINFVLRNKSFLLFLLLFSIGLGLTIQSHSYHKSKFINSANSVSGGVYNSVNSIDQYFHLKTENELLLEDNKALKSLLFNLDINDSIIDPQHLQYSVIGAKVVKNSYSAQDNYLTIKAGTKDSITEDLGVITSKGIVGIIDKTSNNYSRVLSILNSQSRVNAKLKSSYHIGSLIWNTKAPNTVQLVDVSKFANIKIGDTIETGGQSSIFPEGIPIGTILDFKDDQGGDTYNINVTLFNDMTNIGHVYIVTNKDKQEIKALQNNLPNE
ncbi:MAG: rod shape-determining protein MreC [Bacteroidetes bacterium MedPE-SWsnd-G2]|nr:MAG: rod shape-determining protein MreC [Bacteroidetes bacterium MedPE-SWsnd-G2]